MMPAINRCSVAPAPPAERLDSNGIHGIQWAGVVRNTPNRKRLKALPFTSTPTEPLIDRGFTFHEHLYPFTLINMNGRAYDPLVGRFLSADPYIQAPDNTQNLNRYSYCLNNPLRYSDPSGEFIWFFPTISLSGGGLSIGFSFGVGIPGAFSFQAGVSYNFKENDFSGYVGATYMMNTAYLSASTKTGISAGYTAGMSLQSGFPFSTNLGSIGLNYGFEDSELSGNISAFTLSRRGLTFDPSISAMIYPEHTTNFVRGKGFSSNEKVFDEMMRGDYTCDQILDYYGFEGTYNPNTLSFEKYGPDPAHTDPETSEIVYNDSPFEANYDQLAFIADHELQHRKSVLTGRYKGKKLTREMKGLEERAAWLHNYLNEGMYPNHGNNQVVWNINCYSWQGLPDFNSSWWHTWRKIPRLFY